MAAAGVVCGLAATAGAVAAAAATPAGGHIHVFVTPGNGQGNGQILITGAIGDFGTTHKVAQGGKTYGKATLRQGTMEFDLSAINAKANSVNPPVNQRTCSASFSVTAPVPIVNGTGLYANISGTINTDRVVRFHRPALHERTQQGEVQPEQQRAAARANGERPREWNRQLLTRRPACGGIMTTVSPPRRTHRVAALGATTPERIAARGSPQSSSSRPMGFFAGERVLLQPPATSIPRDRRTRGPVNQQTHQLVGASPVRWRFSTRSLRGPVAGMLAAAAWAVQQPLDKRLFRCRFDDVELLGKALTRGPHWRSVGTAMHLANGAAFGILYARLRPRLHRLPAWARGPAVALGEHLASWPATALSDRFHPARAELPQLRRSRRAFAQATWRHLLFGVLLGELDRPRWPLPSDVSVTLR